ncbi:MAG TPA: AAA family ATPase [Ktedonosporobacter sp.]|nr:AAA family ATPase [Ktedonosporobacter sp.]
MLRIFTLGQFRLERYVDHQWRPVTDSAWQQQRVRALLAFLICQPERRVSRTEAMQALWPSSDRESASSKLTKILHRLRKILGSVQAGPFQGSLLRSEGEWLVLAGQEQIWVDADAFEELVVAMDEEEDEPAYERALQEAIALYGGDFLPEGRQVEWVSARHQMLWHTWVGLLLELADLYIARSDTRAAIEVLNRLLANDPSNEAGVQRLISVLARQKRRGEALRIYHRLTEVLQRDYQATPSLETQALYEVVRQGGEAGNLIDMSQLPSPTTLHRIGGQGEPRIGGQAGAEGKRGEEPTQPDQEPRVETSSTSVREGNRGSALEAIGRPQQSPLIGREHELVALQNMLKEIEPEWLSSRLDVQGETDGSLRALRRASGIPHDTMRRPQCVILMGDPGIGKTRLAEEISRQAQRRRWSVVWGHVYSQESAIPYRLLREVLSKALNVGGGFAPTRHERFWTEQAGREASLRRPGAGTLVSSLETLYPLLSLLPELGELLPRTGAFRLPQSTLEQEKLRLWEAACSLLATISSSTPLLIVLDDLQWADASSCELLGYLARHLNGYPVLFVGTCRETELPPSSTHPLRNLIAHMQREHSITTIDLHPLTNEEIERLVSAVSPLSETLVQHIQAHAGGNPLFAEALARTTPPTLPDNIAAALEQRMRKLSEDCQQLLSNASVLGGSFEFGLLHAMESSHDAADEDIILTLLEEALQAGVLTEEGTGTRITYHFWHPLLVQLLYDGVSATRKSRLHLRAADVLLHIHRGREAEVAATITHHLKEGGADPLLIAHHAELAGDRAYVLPAYAEAARHYQLVLQQLEYASGSAGASGRADHPTLSGLLERLAECTIVQGNYEEARRLYERVLELRSRSTSPSLIEEHYEMQVRALLWSEIGWTWRNKDRPRARSYCERGEQVLRAAHIVGGPAWARLRYQQASLNWSDGLYHEAYQGAREALVFFEQQMEDNMAIGRDARTRRILSTRISRILEGDPGHLGMTHRLLGSITNSMGRQSEVFLHLNAALALDEQYSSQREIGHAFCNLGYVHIKREEYDQAEKHLRQALDLADRIGDVPLRTVIFSNKGEIAACNGKLEEAEDWYKKALALQVNYVKDNVYMTLWNAALAIILQEQGKQEDAVACIVRALRIGRATKDLPSLGVALVALGTVRIIQARATHALLLKGRLRLLKRARKDAERALTLPERVAETRPRPELEAETRTRAHLVLAQASFLLDEKERARSEIELVVSEAQNYGLTLVEKQARQLLAQLV